VLAADGTNLLHLSYGDTAELLRVNRGRSRGQSPSSDRRLGFTLDTTTGHWGDGKPQTTKVENLDNDVYLMVADTCNILIVRPDKKIIPEENPEAFLATFQYALERAIQAVYKLEEGELASERLGQGSHLLFWEAAEGGAGV
jgi:hypothetical protein